MSVVHLRSFGGLIIRQKEPRNLETPFDRVESYLTPTELFYIRSHFPTPNLDAASYRLRIGGAVGRPLSLSYEELRNMRSETRTATLECAGNSRVFLVPQVSRWLCFDGRIHFQIHRFYGSRSLLVCDT